MEGKIKAHDDPGAPKSSAAASDDARVYPGAPATADPSIRGGGASNGPSRRRGPFVLLAASLVLVLLSAAYLVANLGALGAEGAQAALFATVKDDAKADAPKGEGAATDGAGTVADAGAAGDSSSAAQGDDSGGAPSSDAALTGIVAGNSDGSSSGAAQGGQSDAQPPAPAAVSVRVIVDSSEVGGSVTADATLSFEPGATAYDALCGCGLSVNASESGLGIYVAGIGGLAEKEHGGQSGWKYSVNGTFPGYASSGYELKDGDVVKWVYVTKL